MEDAEGEALEHVLSVSETVQEAHVCVSIGSELREELPRSTETSDMLEGRRRRVSTHYLSTDLTFTCTDPHSNTDENFDAFTEELADQLEALADVDPGIIDPDLTVRIADRWASTLMGIEADTLDDA